MRLLLVEDSEALRRSLAAGLAEEGYEVAPVASGRAALDEIAARPPALVILDLGLPDLDGLDLLGRARGAGFAAPVLVLTARDAVESRVAALDRGADDYLVKPFAFEELCARVRALLRRAGRPVAAAAACGDLRLDGGEATVAGRPVRLSPTERAVLEALLRRGGREASRREILQEAFGYEFDPGTNVIDVHVAHLRRKLAGSTARIVTVRGVGYRLTAGEDG